MIVQNSQGCLGRSASDSKISFLAFFSLSFILYFDNFLLGKYSLVPYSDFLDSAFILNLKLYAEAFCKYGMFDWFQPLLGGMPAQVQLQPAWSFRTLLAGVLPLWLVIAFVHACVLGTAGFGMFRLLRDYFGTDRRTAFVAGVLYVLACPWPYNYIWLCYFPLSIVHLDEVVSSKTGIAGKVGRLILFLVFALSSIPVFTLSGFSVAHFIFVLCFDSSGEKAKKLAAVFMLWTGYVLLFTPYFLDLFQYIKFASREYPHHYTGFIDALASMNGVFSVLKENMILGLVVFMLPMISVSRRVRGAFAFTIVPLAIYVFLGSDFIYFIKDTLFVKIEIGHPCKQLFHFGSVLFCGFALQEMRRLKKGVNLIWAIVSILVLRTYSNEAIMICNGAIMTFALVAGNPACVKWKKVRGLNLGLVLGCACLIGAVLILKQRDLLKFTHVPFARSFGEYSELERIAGEQKGYDFRIACIDLHPDAVRYYGLDTLGTRHVLTNEYYKEYFAEFSAPILMKYGQAEIFMSRQYDLYSTPRMDNRNDVLFESFYPETKRSIDEWNMPMLLATGVKYIVSPKAIDGIELYAEEPLVDSGLDMADYPWRDFYTLPINIYPVKQPFKMATFMSKTQVFSSRADVLKAMGQADMESMRSTAFMLADDVKGELGKGTGSGEVAEVHREMDAMTVKGRADGPGYVVLAVNYDPRWKCALNGETVDIVRANHTFQAVWIPEAGPFELTFIYADPVVERGYYAWFAGGLLVFGVLFLRTRNSVSVGCREEQADWLFDMTDSGAWKSYVLGGIGFSLLWMAGFYAFIYLRHVDDVLAPYSYLLFQLPVLGCLLTGWVCWLSAKRSE